VVVANRNHPHQTVISGRSHAVAEACRRLADAGLASTPLRVSHAFHSPEMEAASQALVPAVDALPLRPQDGRWFSCITGGRAPSKEPEIRAIFARHACVAVDFESAVRAAAQAGVDTWVQLGAGHALLSMVQATLAASGLAPRALLAIGSVGDAQGRPFIDALARLSALGVDLDPGPLFEGRSLSPCALPAPPRIAIPDPCRPTAPASSSARRLHPGPRGHPSPQAPPRQRGLCPPRPRPLRPRGPRPPPPTGTRSAVCSR
jgi:acyl transferase domain-containing protein